MVEIAAEKKIQNGLIPCGEVFPIFPGNLQETTGDRICSPPGQINQQNAAVKIGGIIRDATLIEQFPL
jgi:hypothetical protein